MRSLVKVSVLAAIAAVLVVAGCSASEQADNTRVASSAAAAPTTVAPPPTPTAGVTASIDPRNVHREASLSMRAQDPEKAEGEIQKILDSVGGYFLESNLTKQDNKSTLVATIKVPVDRFQETIQKISAMGFVTGKRLVAQDVTQQMSALRQEQKYIKQQQNDVAISSKGYDAASKGDAAKVSPVDQAVNESKLNEVENQIKALTSHADFSTIQLTMDQQMTVTPVDKDGGWFQNELGSAVAAFGQGAKAAVVFLLWALVWSPVWVSAIFALRWLDKLSRRKPASA